VPVLDGPPRFDIITEAKGDERLKGFCCGTREKWERDINELVEKQYTGDAVFHPTMVAMMSTSGDVLGVSGFRERGLDFPARGSAPETMPAYVHLIGLSKGFRGWRLQDEKTRLGRSLLGGTLTKVAAAWTGNKMPCVWALIHPDNRDSQRIFKTSGFDWVGARAGDHPWYRPYGLPLF
jgi:hypothetical protein